MNSEQLTASLVSALLRTAMGSLTVSFLCAACSTQQHFDFDVVVGKNVVSVLGANNDPNCSCEGFRFPTPGNCTYTSDVRVCSASECHTCFTDLGLEEDGVRVATGSAQGGAIVTDVSLQSSLDLVLAGCGYETMRVPLQVDSYPTPTVTATMDSLGMVAVTWAIPGPGLMRRSDQAKLLAGCQLPSVRHLSEAPTPVRICLASLRTCAARLDDIGRQFSMSVKFERSVEHAPVRGVHFEDVAVRDHRAAQPRLEGGDVERLGVGMFEGERELAPQRLNKKVTAMRIGALLLDRSEQIGARHDVDIG